MTQSQQACVKLIVLRRALRSSPRDLPHQLATLFQQQRKSHGARQASAQAGSCASRLPGDARYKRRVANSGFHSIRAACTGLQAIALHLPVAKRPPPFLANPGCGQSFRPNPGSINLRFAARSACAIQLRAYCDPDIGYALILAIRSGAYDAVVTARPSARSSTKPPRCRDLRHPKPI